MTGPGIVLIVEDERIERRLLGAIVERLGHRVRFAEDGESALESLRADPDVDVVLLDLMLPGIDGFEVLSRIKETPGLELVPVIIVSARDPMGQPIVTEALAVTRGGGISTHHLLTGIAMLSRLLSPTSRNGGPAPLAMPRE